MFAYSATMRKWWQPQFQLFFMADENQAGDMSAMMSQILHVPPVSSKWCCVYCVLCVLINQNLCPIFGSVELFIFEAILGGVPYNICRSTCSRLAISYHCFNSQYSMSGTSTRIVFKCWYLFSWWNFSISCLVFRNKIHLFTLQTQNCLSRDLNKQQSPNFDDD